MNEKIRTFVDANVLIAAARGNLAYSVAAFEVLDDPTREFVSSLLIRLEVLPKSIFHKQNTEAKFYQDFFDSAQHHVRTSEILLNEAFDLACQFGLNAVDALHVAAALRAKADELITAERPTSPLSRVRGVQITSIYSRS